MKSVFDTATQQELTSRIASLSPASRALWGTMQVGQMVEHCMRCDDMFLGNITVKRAFIGRLIGRLVLKQVLKNDQPFAKNSPTSPVLKTTAAHPANLEAQKLAWINRIAQYSHYNNPGFVHPFFGPVNSTQAGLLAYKHIDHHLRQFGA